MFGQINRSRPEVCIMFLTCYNVINFDQFKNGKTNTCGRFGNCDSTFIHTFILPWFMQ